MVLKNKTNTKSTNLYGSLSRDYVSKLLRNEAAQTQNPYVILIPY